MAVTLSVIKVTNDALAQELIDTGKRMIELGMQLRDHGFDVPIEYTMPSDIEQDHDHLPVQHRDGRPPWCNACGLTAGGQEPESRF